MKDKKCTNCSSMNQYVYDFGNKTKLCLPCSHLKDRLENEVDKKRFCEKEAEE